MDKISMKEDFIIPGPAQEKSEPKPPLEITPEMRRVFSELHDKYFSMESGYLSLHDKSFNARCSVFVKTKIYSKFGMDEVSACFLSHIFGSTFSDYEITRYDFEGEYSIEAFINREYEIFNKAHGHE